MTRAAFAVALLAFGMRAGAALLTERYPVFPAYYYTDAAFADQNAMEMVSWWREGKPLTHGLSPSQRAYATYVALVYYAVGHRPLAVKLLNAAVGSLSVAFLCAAAAPIVGPGAALAAGLFAALWPSHVFNTAQNFKDPLTLAFCWAGLWLFLSAPRQGLGAGFWARAAGGFAAFFGLGFLRAYMLVLACAALAAGLLWSAARERGQARAGALLALGIALSSIPVYSGAGAPLLGRHVAFAEPGVSDVKGETGFGVRTFDSQTNEHIRPTSPENLADMRRNRQQSDRDWAAANAKREIGTQLFVGQRFSSWLDVALFMPKAAFHVLFMPLPGLYPMDGKRGRLLAAWENVVLLLLAAAAAASLLRRRLEPASLTLLAFFSMMTAGSALLEFDLGSATRHKLAYLPALFPFAFSWLGRRREPSGGRLKVMQVLECGGPGGTGNQVAALCNALPADRFETVLVYATRPGCSPEEYRASAGGAAKAFYIPEMCREIAPLRDLAAFRKLWSLFRQERPDVVHAHSSKAGVLARAAAWLAGVPRVFYTPHGYAFLQTDRSRLSRALYRLVELSVSWIGTIVAVSPSEAALARALSWGKPVETVCDPFLGELPAPKAAEVSRKIRVGACGRLTAARRPDAFVNLAQRLTDSRNDLSCVWIGGGELEPEMRRHLENMNLGQKVEITGWLPQDEARRRLAECDVVVHYSRWDGLPNAVLEAMAHGLPVVASDAPGCRDAVLDGETGYLAGDERALLERTLALVDDAQKRLAFGKAGRERVEREFAAARAWRRWEALYKGERLG